MTTHSTALCLFASTIATSLGFVMTMNGAAPALLGEEGEPMMTLLGIAVMLLGGAVFVGLGSRALRDDRQMMRVVLGAFGAGVLSVWFWLVPANTAILTVACRAGHLDACAKVAERGGFPADVAHANDDFVKVRCQVDAEGRYCRLAAAKRLLKPNEFCMGLSTEEGFEVVEWCTPNVEQTLLVARR